MKRMLKRIGRILPVIAVLCSCTAAAQLKCEYRLDNLEIEPMLKPGAERSYDVHVSCVLFCTHHNGEEHYKYHRKTLSPVVVAQQREEGRAEANRQGEVDAARQGWVLLLEGCALKKCKCADKGCACMACGTPAPLSSSLKFRMENAPIPQRDASKSNPIVLKGISNPDQIKRAIDDYVDRNFDGAMVGGYIKTMDNDRFIEMAFIMDKNHKAKLVYFDMTDIYKKLKRTRDKSAREKVERLIERHRPLTKEAKEKLADDQKLDMRY